MTREKTYWSRELADLLEIGTSTLRKWCLQLEKDGYTFLRDEHERRAFTEHDVIALRFFKDLSKNKGMTLENASIAVVSRYNRDENTSVTLSASPVLPRSDERYMELLDKVNLLVDHVAKQDAFNQALLTRLEQQQQYLEESVRRRDEQLMAALREIQDTKQLLVSTKEEPVSFWRSLFKNK